MHLHLHQHLSIPFNDVEGTCLEPSEIHEGTVSDMYHFCVKYGLSQVWVYMWNQWYCPEQWKLWAQSVSFETPVLKLTMIVESLWRVLKHRDLSNFNRPRLDLVTYIILMKTLPRVQNWIRIILSHPGCGNAITEWQKDFQTSWLDLSKLDEQ
ncbi:hypothetical protein PUNSTDRAFT_63578 [Punctularia strigosozonata HHB-11173 SS5]|uniref:uncharacterized protein n=1 Tax=Punctularia strigosozonata (strain HHB-11173) TaxID=741275 RepID=UPI000441715B|nr:uncharacterized protein PUNSTDRAFT_63578 [Punctularia strigosozonata HHB-11173 SS5]EIN11346.1 hypothetical protein PUNSTDRAFT_63578 [Punctularia strigosozonata HHB-11173 SS5]